MANIPFKSITFPGLSNKYTVPEISNDLMTAGKAADAKATGDALSALEDAVTEETDKLKADLDAQTAITDGLFEDFTLKNDYILNNMISASRGKWVNGNFCYYFPVPNAKYMKVTASQEQAVVYALLAETNVVQDGLSPVYAQGSGRSIIPAGETSLIEIPDDCAYVYFLRRAGDIFYTPASVMFSASIESVNDSISKVEDNFFTDSELLNWQIGSYNYPDGNYYAYDARLRLIDYVGVTEKVYSAQAGDGYEMAVFAWNAETKAYVGAYIADKGFATSGTLAWMPNFDFSDYPEYAFRIVIRDAANHKKSMDISEAKSCTFKLSKFKTDKTLSLAGAIADSGATGLRFTQIENALTKRHGITHEMPNSQGELNVVRRARQLTDIKWTPAFDFTRISQLAGYSGGANDPYYFEDVFKAGVEYTGIPYGQANLNTSQWGYDSTSGFKVGWGVGLDTFISAIGCAESVVAKESSFYAQGARHRAGFYATVCTALCGYALELPTYYASANIGYAPGMQYLGKVKDLDLENLNLGDMLWNIAHGAILTDKLRDENGDIIAIELSEETTIGNDDWNVQGSQLGGIARRRMWMLADFLKWKDYGVYRYDNVDNTTYTKSPYVDTGDEGEALRIVHFPVLPYMGENFRYIENHIANTKILTPGYKAGATDKLRVKKDGENWNVNGTTDYYDVSGQYVEVGFSAPGTYEAYLCQLSNGEEIIQTRAGHWTVVAE